ncbi:uncharacterized protein SAPINGB_P001505 [Magnusiomyces paraingens]|uniref:L-serine ammonia-lyase n=1 Tax=Magnusiomyces paraingens TaxID=2606893 RepID=A0A5E8B863_9ASCO|nr:uncharacterized protein SAPINGB_P001505 [Saprochaete ingens]VVT47023.1 unnamed protein product [Saprochaete ingens]
MTSSTPLPYIETPLVPSLYLSELTGANVYLKLELTQPSGSFKSRGLGNLVYKTITGKNTAVAPHLAHTPTGSFPGAPANYYHFFSPSGGNAGCATAYAARQYLQKCTVCLPTTSNPLMVDRIRKTGATVVVYGATIAEADAHIRNVLIPSCKEVAVYCHPYNDTLVWEGNSTVATEIVKQLEPHLAAAQFTPPPSSLTTTSNIQISSKSLEVPQQSATLPTPSTSPKFNSVSSSSVSNLLPSPNASSLCLASNNIPPPSSSSPSLSSKVIAICSVGGGGLYNGLGIGFSLAGWSDVSLVAVETEGCATLNQSINAGGKQVEIPAPKTIATSLSTISVTRETIDYAMGSRPTSFGPLPCLNESSSSSLLSSSNSNASPTGKTHSLVVSDREAAEACIRFAHDHKMMVEAACGTALAPLYNGKIKEAFPNLSKDDTIVVVVCGGTSVSWDILKGYSETFDIPF